MAAVMEQSVGSIQRWAERNPDGTIYLLGAGSVGAVLVFGSALASTAMLTGLLSCASGLILLKKLPDTLEGLPLIGQWLPQSWQEVSPRVWVIQHQLIVDISVSVGAICLFGATITGILAGAIAGILTSCSLTLLERLER